jgi:hypothetical protein
MKKIIFCCMLSLSIMTFAQKTSPGNDTRLTPGGTLDKVFDQYGNSYKLSEITTSKSGRDSGGETFRSSDPTPMTCGYFNLYLEDGCGLSTTDTDYLNRRAVICQVFTDLSAFISSPLTTTGKRVNIWIRNINNIPNVSSSVLGLATSFYNIPYNATAGFGGIADNEIWKTIHSGTDSFASVVSPLYSSGLGSGSSGAFYHGMIALNFSSVNWHTNLTTAAPSGYYDLYTIILHEVTHALGFASLLNENGLSKFGVGYNYYSRYDKFLKNNANTQSLITNTGACSTMYNYVFNTALSPSILTPGCTAVPPTSSGSADQTTCSSAIRYVGLSNIPVYTPICFEAPSSLSHFEDQCVSPNVNNAYFVMSNANGAITPNNTKRFLKPEERNVLKDLGYTVATTYGSTTNLTYKNYGGTVTTGITVAGINDGINTDASYAFTGNVNTAIVINSSTDTTKRLLSNDINATSFECLQDVSSAATFNVTSGTATTNITFTTAVAGQHLLRYVPINAAGQRGNITYIFVYVVGPSSCTVNTCDLVANGNFEQYTSLPDFFGQITRACGWSEGNGQSPEYLHHNSTNVHIQVPCSDFGYETDKIAGNNAYVGMTVVQQLPAPAIASEPIKTTLVSGLAPNTNYQLSFDVSVPERNSQTIKFQAYLSQTPILGLYYGAIPMTGSGIFIEDTGYSNVSTGWGRVVLNFTTPASAGHQYLYIGGLGGPNNVTFVPRTPLAYTCGLGDWNYYFVDNVSLIALNGGSFTLPATLCSHDSLPNLNAYLNGLPTNGVFSGPGVSLDGGSYTLNTMSDMNPGVNTITYTYTNGAGCKVAVYSNINIQMITPIITGSTSAYPTPPNNTTTNSTTIPSGYTAAWTITGGTGTITSGGTSASVNATWTNLPGELTLTLTNTTTGCSFSSTQTIFNQFSCNCLSTEYFTYAVSGYTVTITVHNSNPSCPLSGTRWLFGDGTRSMYYNPPTISHTFTTVGTYTISMEPCIVGGPYADGCYCSAAQTTASITITDCRSCIRDGRNSIIIYPNPTSSLLNISVPLKEDSPFEAIIRGIDGKELLRRKWKLNKGDNELMLELPNNISEGMIFVDLISDEIRETKTVMIKK